MSIKRKALCFVLLFILTVGFAGCADKKSDAGTEGVAFRKIAGFTDPRGQGKIRLFVYSGEPEIEDIKRYTEKLGCGMLFAYYYPESTDRNEIPIEGIESAQSLVEARDILYKGEGVSKWRFGTQCFSLIPTITDCQESPISMNCR